MKININKERKNNDPNVRKMQDLDSLILDRSQRARKCSPTRRTSVTLSTYMKVKSKCLAGNGTLS